MKMTVLLVSHSMEDVANYVDRIIVLNHGSLMLDGTPAKVFPMWKNWNGYRWQCHRLRI